MSSLMILLGVLAAVTLSSAEFHTGDKVVEAKLDHRFATWHHLTCKSCDTDDRNVASKNVVDDKIIAFLEDAREHFSEGFPEAGIPPLDPFTLGSITFHVNQGNIIKANITLKDLMLTGAKSFIIDNIKFKILGLSLEFGFTVPELTFTTNFNVDGKVAKILPFKVNGDLTVQLKDLSITGKATLGTSDGCFMFVKNIDLAFNIGGSKIQVDNLLDVEFFNKVLNWILDQLSDDFFEGQKEALAKYVSESLIEVANDLLADTSLCGIIG